MDGKMISVEKILDFDILFEDNEVLKDFIIEIL